MNMRVRFLSHNQSCNQRKLALRLARTEKYRYFFRYRLISHKSLVIVLGIQNQRAADNFRKIKYKTIYNNTDILKKICVKGYISNLLQNHQTK